MSTTQEFKTIFAPSGNPFIVTNDPPPPSEKRGRPSKYTASFDRLIWGQAIKCTTPETMRVAAALRAYADVKKLNATIRTMKDYGDGMGRVWLLPKGAFL